MYLECGIYRIKTRKIMDHLTKEQRYKNMSANKGKGTKLELLFGKLLWNAGVRYRKNDNTVFGKPDFVIRKKRIAIFCDGEFWHGRNWEERKKDHKSNCDFWYSKIDRNIKRDKEVNEQLKAQGWTVFRFWETEITKESDKCLNIILNCMNAKNKATDKIVYAGDQNLNKIQDLFYPIIMILRQEKDGNYNYRLQDKDVVIQTPTGEELLRIPASVFLVEAENLLKAINENDGAFGLPQIEVFMNSIYCHSLKAKSSDKTDIRIILHDRRTKINSEMGFSIKSQLGGDSTLLNASKATNFNFKVTGVDLSDNEITAINSINPKRNKVIERVNAIKKKGASLEFDKVDNSTFRNNLVMLDSDLPAIIANLLLEQLNTGISTLKELAEKITKNNPLKYDVGQASPFYAYKIKHLLTSAALGMMPATAWSGKYDANGGYLVVKRDGEVLCYHP